MHGLILMADTTKQAKHKTAGVVHSTRRRFLGWVGAGLAAWAIPRQLWSEENIASAYRETIEVLTMLHRGEVESRLLYHGYEKQALKEGHDHIAHLFAAMAESEFIHEQRFSEILARLGVPVDTSIIQPKIRVGSTKENLKYATEVELSEIDIHYPEYLARIQAEKHSIAIKYITYAWKSERQHRDLVKDIQSGTGIFFGMLAEHFRNTPVRYFVCQNCGSTLTRKPDAFCPICNFAASWYKEITLPTV